MSLSGKGGGPRLQRPFVLRSTFARKAGIRSEASGTPARISLLSSLSRRFSKRRDTLKLPYPFMCRTANKRRAGMAAPDD